MATVDFDKASTGFTVVPDGTYLIRIKKYERKKAKSGNPTIYWTGVIIEGPLMGTTVMDFTTITDLSVWRVANLIKCASITVSGKLDTDSAQFNTILNAVVGQSMYWKIIKETNEQGKDVNKVDGYAIDTNQQPVMVDDSDDAPAWLKE